MVPRRLRESRQLHPADRQEHPARPGRQARGPPLPCRPRCVQRSPVLLAQAGRVRPGDRQPQRPAGGGGMPRHLRGERMGGVDHRVRSAARSGRPAARRRRRTRQPGKGSAAAPDFASGRRTTASASRSGRPAICRASALASVVPPRIRSRICSASRSDHADDRPRPLAVDHRHRRGWAGRPVSCRTDADRASIAGGRRPAASCAGRRHRKRRDPGLAVAAAGRIPGHSRASRHAGVCRGDRRSVLLRHRLAAGAGGPAGAK